MVSPIVNESVALAVVISVFVVVGRNVGCGVAGGSVTTIVGFKVGVFVGNRLMATMDMEKGLGVGAFVGERDEVVGASTKTGAKVDEMVVGAGCSVACSVGVLVILFSVEKDEFVGLAVGKKVGTLDFSPTIGNEDAPSVAEVAMSSS